MTVAGAPAPIGDHALLSDLQTAALIDTFDAGAWRLGPAHGRVGVQPPALPGRHAGP